MIIYILLFIILIQFFIILKLCSDTFTAVKKDDSKVIVKLKVLANNILFKFENVSSRNEKHIIEKLDIRQKVTGKLIKLHNGQLTIKKEGNKLLHIDIALPGKIYTDFYEVEDNDSRIDLENKQSENLGDKSEDDIFENKEKTDEKKKSILIIGKDSSSFNSLQNIMMLNDYSIQKKKERKGVSAKINNNVSLVIINGFSLNKKTTNLCQKIRNRFSLFELPILMIASRSTPEDMTRGFDVGINDFIKKPFEINELKARVRTLITLKERVEESVKREQDYLRAQINPHFLYNTLDTIAYLCRHNPGQAGKLVLSLANYLRYSFDFESLTELVPISKELDLVKFYLSIQKERFKERINIEYNIEENISFAVPPLSLQSIVENAVKHGIIKKDGGGKIIINVKKKDNFFEVEVIDNGVGLAKKELADILGSDPDNRERKRIGLKNINSRLKKVYNQELIIKSKKGKGTTVRFLVPDKNIK